MEEQEKQVAIVVTLDGVFGFIGELAEENSGGFVLLNKALTIGYDTDGVPFPVFGQLPVGSADPSKPMCTRIPVSNVSYIVTLGSNDKHSLVDQYYAFFNRLGQAALAAG